MARLSTIPQVPTRTTLKSYADLTDNVSVPSSSAPALSSRSSPVVRFSDSSTPKSKSDSNSDSESTSHSSRGSSVVRFSDSCISKSTSPATTDASSTDAKPVAFAVPVYRAPSTRGQPVPRVLFKKDTSTPKQYVTVVESLNCARINRRFGAGTLEDPAILWLCKTAGMSEARKEAVEAICSRACKAVGCTILWIRMSDHSTTRSQSAAQTRKEMLMSRGQAQGKARVIGQRPDDPHITAFIGNSPTYDFEGHIFVSYANDGRKIPVRFADPKEREYCKPDEPEPIVLWDRRESMNEAFRLGLFDRSRGDSYRGTGRRCSTDC
ncbi:hypothetical protein BJY04DRAFT_220387 [Aspergillus karnatakaensis]|uniref:uncharacterized protein n=1 Tax=Aspergillus karnatakaensis TaxID=1810916 RepID=UPI003CCD8779